MRIHDNLIFEWKNRRIVTYQDLIWAVFTCASPEEAQQFMISYELAVSPAIARSNVGYIIGEVDRDTGRRIIEWFGVEHPVFGTTYPTASEALQAGMQAGKAMLEKGRLPPNPWFTGALK